MEEGVNLIRRVRVADHTTGNSITRRVRRRRGERERLLKFRQSGAFSAAT